MTETLFNNLMLFVPVFAGIIFYLTDLLWKEGDKEILAYPAIAVLSGLLYFFIINSFSEHILSFFGLDIDKFRILIAVVVIFFATLSLLMFVGYDDRKGAKVNSFLPLYFFLVFGFLLLILFSNLLFVYAGLVIITIIFISLLSDFAPAQLLKRIALYLVLTDLIFGFGMAFYYGATSTFDLLAGGELTMVISRFDTANFLRLGAVFMIVSLFAKAAVFPLQAWIKHDNFDGDLRIFVSTFIFGRSVFLITLFFIFNSFILLFGNSLILPIYIVAFLTIFRGIVTVSSVRSLRELVVSSSTIYMGYILVALPVILSSYESASMILTIFLLTYFAGHMGLAVVSDLMMKDHCTDLEFTALNGYGFHHKVISIFFSLFIAALAGIPPFIGFVGRFLLIKDMVRYASFVVLIVLIISIGLNFYYLMRPIVRLYFFKPSRERSPLGEVGYGYIFLIVTSFMILFLGSFSSTLLKWITTSINF